MGESRVKKLYRKLGPVLFARANRALKDSKLAEQLVKEVCIELGKLEGVTELSDAELLKKGRARMAEIAGERANKDAIFESLKMR
jgi:hypothetical protein